MHNEKFKRSATLLDDGMVRFEVDKYNVTIRKLRGSDLESWPKLVEQVEARKAKPKPKKRRSTKVRKDDAEGNAKSGNVGDGIL